MGELGLGGRAGSSADSLAEEEEEDEDEEGPGSGRSSRTSSLVSGLLTELYSAAEAAAPSASARSPGERELQQRPSQVKYLRLKGTARSAPFCPALPAALPCPACCPGPQPVGPRLPAASVLPGPGAAPVLSLSSSVPARESSLKVPVASLLPPSLCAPARTGVCPCISLAVCYGSPYAWPSLPEASSAQLADISVKPRPCVLFPPSFAIGAVGAKMRSPATRVSVTDCTSFCASVNSVLFFAFRNESMSRVFFFLSFF